MNKKEKILQEITIYENALNDPLFSKSKNNHTKMVKSSKTRIIKIK